MILVIEEVLGNEVRWSTTGTTSLKLPSPPSPAAANKDCMTKMCSKAESIALKRDEKIIFELMTAWCPNLEKTSATPDRRSPH